MRPDTLEFGRKYYVEYDIVRYIVEIEYSEYIQIGSILKNRIGVGRVISAKHNSSSAWEPTWTDSSPRLLVNLDDKDILIINEVVEDTVEKPSYIPDGWRLK